MPPLPPEKPFAGSDRGTYSVFLANTTLLPGTHSSLANLNGPEPTISATAWFGSVEASRFGMITGTFASGLASVSSTRPYG